MEGASSRWGQFRVQPLDLLRTQVPQQGPTGSPPTRDLGVSPSTSAGSPLCSLPRANRCPRWPSSLRLPLGGRALALPPSTASPRLLLLGLTCGPVPPVLPLQQAPPGCSLVPKRQPREPAATQLLSSFPIPLDTPPSWAAKALSFPLLLVPNFPSPLSLSRVLTVTSQCPLVKINYKRPATVAQAVSETPRAQGAVGRITGRTGGSMAWMGSPSGNGESSASFLFL